MNETLYLCIKNPLNKTHFWEKFTDKEAVGSRIDQLRSQYNLTTGLQLLNFLESCFTFTHDDQEGVPRPVGTYETEDYIVIFTDENGNNRWDMYKNAKAAFNKRTLERSAHRFAAIWNIQADIGIA